VSCGFLWGVFQLVIREMGVVKGENARVHNQSRSWDMLLCSVAAIVRWIGLQLHSVFVLGPVPDVNLVVWEPKATRSRKN